MKILSKLISAKKIFILFAAAYIFYILFCVIVLPLFQGKTGSGSDTNRQALAAESEAGERVLCVDDNLSALLWRLRLIETAKEEIALTSFEFAADKSGTDIMASLLHAAERGVKVRILTDGIWGMFHQRGDGFDVLTAHENIEVKLYNTVNLLTPWDINYRMHDKCLIVDDRMYMLGGRNTMDLFLGEYGDKANTDRDVLVYREKTGGGASIWQVKRYFERLWALSCNKTLTCGPPKDAVKAQLREHYAELREMYPEGFSEPDWLGETLPADSVSLICNPVSNAKKSPELWDTLCDLMAKGKNVVIQTPYIICGGEMYRGLSEITRQGTRIAIITNAVANGANPWGCTDYLNQKDNILKTGVSVYEYYGAHSLHTKTVLIDDRVSVIGSFNMDMRSAYLDTETMLVIDCPDLNARLRNEAAAQMDAGNRVSPDGTESLGASCEVKRFGPLKNAVYAALRVIVRPIRHIL